MKRMGKKISKVLNREFTHLFFCPGCKLTHGFNAGEGSPKPVWQFNNDFEKPTLKPSHKTWWSGKVNGKWEKEANVCHSYIKDGMIQFLSDCTHELKNQTVALPDIDKAYK